MKETTYRKLRTGDWGIAGKDLETGERVIVRKRSGQTRPVIVGAIVWSGADGTTIARVGSDAQDSESTPAPRTVRRAYRPASAAIAASPVESRGVPSPAWEDVPPPSDDDYLTY